MNTEDKQDIIQAIRSAARHLEDSLPQAPDLSAVTIKLERIIELLEEIRDK